MIRSIRIVEFFGEIDDGFPQPFVVKSPDAVDSPFPHLQEKMSNKINSKKCWKLTRSGCILKEGSDLNIHIHKKHFQQWKILTHNPKDDLMCKTNIEFDDLWQHLISKETKSNFKVEFDDTISGLQFWPVAEAYANDLGAPDAQTRYKRMSVEEEYDSSGRVDHEDLRTVKRWVRVDHLMKFKLVITSRPEYRITQTFPDSTGVHILSGTGVEPGDSASHDIHAFCTSRLKTMGVEPAWIAKALDYLVPRAVGIIIWMTTVANFLEDLYTTVVKTLFGHVGTVILTKQSLCGGFTPLVDSTAILPHRSFEGLPLWRDLPALSTIPNESLHERQLAMPCSNTMVSSELRFNMCSLDSSSIKNVDIPAIVKSAIPPRVSCTSRFLVDSLVHTVCDEPMGAGGEVCDVRGVTGMDGGLGGCLQC